MNKFIRGLAILGIIAFGSILACSPQSEEKKLFLRVTKVTAPLVSPKNLDTGGTGFNVKAPSGKVYTLTNRHVCELGEKEGYLISRASKELTRLRIIAVSQTTDLCLLEAIPDQDGLEVAQDASRFDYVYVVGHPFLQPVTLTKGYIKFREKIGLFSPEPNEGACIEKGDSYKWEMVPTWFGQTSVCLNYLDAFWTDAQIYPGNSGSAMVNIDGEVVGVVFAGNAVNLGFAIPLSEVKAFLSAY